MHGHSCLSGPVINGGREEDTKYMSVYKIVYNTPSPLGLHGGTSTRYLGPIYSNRIQIKQENEDSKKEEKKGFMHHDCPPRLTRKLRSYRFKQNQSPFGRLKQWCGTKDLSMVEKTERQRERSIQILFICSVTHVILDQNSLISAGANSITKSNQTGFTLKCHSEQSNCVSKHTECV